MKKGDRVMFIEDMSLSYYHGVPLRELHRLLDKDRCVIVGGISDEHWFTVDDDPHGYFHWKEHFKVVAQSLFEDEVFYAMKKGDKVQYVGEFPLDSYFGIGHQHFVKDLDENLCGIIEDVNDNNRYFSIVGSIFGYDRRKFKVVAQSLFEDEVFTL